MTPDTVSRRQNASATATRLAIEAPSDTRFAPLVETAAHVFVRSLPGVGAPLEGEVQRQLSQAFCRAAVAHSDAISIILRYAPPILEAAVAPAGREEVVLRFAIG